MLKSVHILAPALLLASVSVTGCGPSETGITDYVPALSVLPESVDFGEVVAGETEKQTLTLENSGKDTLVLDSVLLDDGSAGVFTFSFDPVELEPDAYVPLEVYFTPPEFTTYTDTLRFIWNSEKDSPTLIPIAGTGVDIDRPDIGSDPSDCLDFGDLAAGETDEMSIKIVNDGEDDLVIDRAQITGAGTFSVAPDLGGQIVSAGGFIRPYVTYAPITADGDSATLKIYSNDPDENPYEICLEGNGGGSGNYPIAEVVCPDDTTPMSTVSFDGSGSYDPGDSEPLTYDWALSRTPDGSSAVLTGSDTTAELYMDIAGDYTVSLTVTNSLGVPSAPYECEVSAVPTEDVRVELVWNTDDSDLDLHLAEDAADLYAVPGDVSYCNEAPDWGNAGDASDDPLLAADDEDGYGPEVIEIVTPQDGNYHVRVHYFEDEGGGATRATVRIYVYGSLAEEVSYTLTRNEVWDVGWIRWPMGYVVLEEEVPEGAEHRSCWTE